MSDIQIENETLLQEPRYPRKGWIGVDLDGTLAKCESNPDPHTIGPPVPLMHQRVRYWLRTGREVKIFTARASDEQQRMLVEQWCKKYGLENLEITDRKDFRMVVLWDDRAVGVVTNMGIPILPNRLTLWQRLRLTLSILFHGHATVTINKAQLRGHTDEVVNFSRELVEY